MLLSVLSAQELLALWRALLRRFKTYSTCLGVESALAQGWVKEVAGPLRSKIARKLRGVAT